MIQNYLKTVKINGELCALKYTKNAIFGKIKQTNVALDENTGENKDVDEYYNFYYKNPSQEILELISNTYCANQPLVMDQPLPFKPNEGYRITIAGEIVYNQLPEQATYNEQLTKIKECATNVSALLDDANLQKKLAESQLENSTQIVQALQETNKDVQKDLLVIVKALSQLIDTTNQIVQERQPWFIQVLDSISIKRISK